jgi:hypothetical protein
MTNKRIILIGLFALALVVVLVVFLVPGDKTTRAVAAFGVFFTIAKIVYDICDKERERKKKAEENRERVKAEARYGWWDTTGFELGVVIYNEGTTPVHIQSVTCHYIPRDGSQETTLALDNMERGRTQLLHPRHTARFRYGLFKDEELSKIAALPKENVWITINSYQGEIYRVAGEDIIKVLNSPPTHQGDV